MKFGERLRELRRRHGLSQRDLAVQVGVDFTYLSKIETGDSEFMPSEDLILRLAQALNVDGNRLICLAGKIPPKLKDMMQGNPLLTELVRVLSEKPLPSEVYLQMVQLATKGTVGRE